MTIENSPIENIIINNSSIGTFRCNNNLLLIDFSIKNCEFKSISFHESTIHGKLSMSECKHGEILFKLCEIKVKEVSLTNSSIELLFQKIRSYVKPIFRFNGSQKSKISLERCYFSEEVLFQGQQSDNERNLFITYTVFKDLVLFDDDHCKCLVVKECLFQNGLLLPIVNINKPIEVSSSVWCILKNQAVSRNENISALEYRTKELISYSKELKDKKIKCQERIVLFLNRCSNYHGIDWGRGLLFTLGSWIIFYALFTLSKDDFYCLIHTNCKFALFDSNYMADALNYLWIPEGLNDLSNALIANHSLISSISMILFFVLGKILIAYGAFQTISAFRRHGKA
jgi:hypothetical protein